MDDLAGKINEILNDPQAMQQMSALASMLGAQKEAGEQQGHTTQESQTQSAQAVPVGGLDQLGALSNLGNLSALSSLLGGQQNQQTPQNPLNGELMQTIVKIMPLLSQFQEEDANTRLLMSLRPLLGPERRRKLDEAAKMMKMFRLLPMLKSQGIL